MTGARGLLGVGLVVATLLGCETTGSSSPGAPDVGSDAGGDAAVDAGCAQAGCEDAAPPVDGCPDDPDKVAPGLCGCGVADTDADDDGTADCDDGCPADPAKTAPGACGCGAADVDGDEDETADCVDGCPGDADKTAPGVCGCGVADADGDADGTLDCEDACAEDPGKTEPGACGCGVADADADGDEVLDCEDACPDDADKVEPGVCGCGAADVDRDRDRAADCVDACPDDPRKSDPLECGCGVVETPNCDEVDPPVPNPARWATGPHATSTTSVSMTAVVARDPSGVEYYFECVVGGCHDSEWQAGSTYEDTGLAPDHTYSYRVRARDMSLNRNETAWSPDPVAVTDADEGLRAGVDAWYYDFDIALPALPDLSAREPNIRSVQEQVNHRRGGAPWPGTGAGFADTFGSRHAGFLRVEAAGEHTLYLAVDDGGTLWLDGAQVLRAVEPGEVSVTLDLAAGYHPFRLDAYDDAGDAELVLLWATPLHPRRTIPSAAFYRADPPDLDPPSPNPLAWAAPPAAMGADAVEMTAQAASDRSGVQYFFECTEGPCNDSGWQTRATYRDAGLPPATRFGYRVRARDLSAAESKTDWTEVASAVTDTFVPDLVGTAEALAEPALVEAALVVGVVTRARHPEAPRGEIIGQDPPAGARVAAGAAVDLVVSLGLPVDVPDVVGEAAADAEARLEAAELVTGEVTEAFSCSAPTGQVIGQDPAGGAQASVGAAVDLVVSAGPGAAVISEIMYHPQLDHLPREFVELHNPCVSALRLDGWTLTGVGQLAFAADATIEPGGYRVLAQDPVAFEAAYGFAPDGGYPGTLANDGETLRLVRPDESVAVEVDFEDVAPWPVTPDGFGPSLEVVDPSRDNATPRNWHASIAEGGHTAGAVNSVDAEGLPPWISEVDHGAPSPDQPIIVTAVVEDADAVSFTYVVDWGAPVEVEMRDDGRSGDGAAGDGVYGVVVPGQPMGAMIRYRLDAAGPTGAMGHPRDDDTVTWRGTYLVDPTIASDLPVLHWIIDPAVYQAALGHFRSNELEPADLFHEGVLYTGVQMRVRGQSSRGWPKKHWKFNFPKGNGFANEAITPAPVDEFNLQASYGDKSYMREILSYETFTGAGAPSHLASPVVVYQNGAFYGLYIWVEDKDGQQLDRNGVDGDGGFYKGYSQCEYRPLAQLPGRFEKKNPEDGDFTELHDLLDGINNLEGQARRDFIFDRLDIPAMLTYQAASVLVHNNDQVAKNYFLFQDINRTRRWTFHVWDVDLTFGRSYEGRVLNDRIFADDDDVGRANVSPSHPLFGDRSHQKWDFLWNRITDALLSEPDIRTMYYRRLRTVMDDLLAPGRYEARIDELAALIGAEATTDKATWNQYGVPETLAVAVTRLKDDYLAPRRTHLFETHRVDGEIPEAQTANPQVVITELMYNPQEDRDDPDDNASDREFLELYNPSPTEAVDLSGWQVEGVDIVIPAGAVILPQSHLLLVRNDVVFRATYGSGHFVAGQYGGKLAGGGERVALLDRAGEVVDEVTYDDVAPWPIAADGGGPSLELIDPALDNSAPASWAPSLRPGGSPGAPR